MVLEVEVDFGSKFEKIANGNWNQIVDSALKRMVVEADSICQKEAPVRTGTLRRSIGVSHPGMCVVCLTGVNYWGYVQYGTSRQSANPFVTRTIMEVKSKRLFELNLRDVLISQGIY